MAAYDRPVWLHPYRGADFPDYRTETKSKFEIWWAFGWAYETSVAMARLVFAGIFDRHPRIKIITHHLGAMAPYFEGRIGPGWDQLGTRTSDEDYRATVLQRLKKRPLDYFRMFYGDTALFGAYDATECGVRFFGPGRVRLRLGRAVRSRAGPDVHPRDDRHRQSPADLGRGPRADFLAQRRGTARHGERARVRNRRPLDWAWALGAPFAALGTAAAWTTVAWLSDGRGLQETAGMAVLALLVGGIGTGLIVMSVRANRATLQRNRLAAAYPDEPWRWRPDWDAMRLTHTSRRFGTTVLELTTLPGIAGGEIAGTIVPSFPDRQAGGFQVTLTAVHVYVTGAGKRRRVHEDVQWEGSGTAPIEATAAGSRAHFAIAIPGDAPETNDDHPNNEILWRLTASADVHGRRFTAGFVVPVFR